MYHTSKYGERLFYVWQLQLDMVNSVLSDLSETEMQRKMHKTGMWSHNPQVCGSIHYKSITKKMFLSFLFKIVDILQQFYMKI